MPFQIGERPVGLFHKPFIIAEMSGNHNRSLERALAIVKAAADTGVDAIKLQTYTPDSLTIDVHGGLFDIMDPNSLWYGRNLYELYKEAMTPYEWHEPIFKAAKDLGLICFSTPFDEQAVDMLENLGAPAHKIASFENNHFPLIRKIAKTGKPIIISSGVSTLSGLSETMELLADENVQNIALLKCTSTYPSTPENTNLLTIPHMRALFGCEVGLSDHTMGVGVSVAAVAHGGTVIEKHFCLSRAEGGVDSAFSLEPDEMRLLVAETERAWQALGQVQYGIQAAERNSLNFKRSIYIISDIEEGESFTPAHLGIIRPGDGLAPKFIDKIIGLKAAKAVKRGTPASWEMLSR